MPVPISSIREQHRIVAILDEAFEGIATAKANAEKNLQNSKELFKSHLHTLFANPESDGVESHYSICVTQTVGSHTVSSSLVLKSPQELLVFGQVMSGGFGSKRKA